MDIGVAGTIQTKHFYSANMIDEKINRWLDENMDTEIIDIKLSACATNDDVYVEALIIYRKEG